MGLWPAAPSLTLWPLNWNLHFKWNVDSFWVSIGCLRSTGHEQWFSIFLNHRLIFKSHGTYKHSGKHAQRVTHKLFPIQFWGSPEHQSIGEEVLYKSLRSLSQKSHSVSTRGVRGRILQEAELKLSFEIEEKLNRNRSEEGHFRRKECIGKQAQELEQQIFIFTYSKETIVW